MIPVVRSQWVEPILRDAEMQNATIYACMAVSVGLLVVMRRGRRGENVLFYVGAFFALFAFGPVINYLVGNPVYFGIRENYIDDASVGFTFALAGLAVAHHVTLAERRQGAASDVDSRCLYQFFPPLLVVLIAYGAVVAVRVLPASVASNKFGQIALAGPGHNVYLLIELCVVSTYFLTRRTALLRTLWYGNTIVYVVYCLATSERDFLFVLFSVLLHRYVVERPHGRPVQVVLAGLGAVVLASLLFASRSGDDLDLASVLNQGSLLFVDSFVMEWLPRHQGFSFGGTYVQTILSLPPTWIYDSGVPSLSAWLVQLYAPGSDGGYGFSLSAEAYMNFGFAGVFVVFVLLGLSIRAIATRFGRSDWRSFLSVYYLAIVLYAIRGDSSQVIKSVVYGTIFFAVISITSGTATRSHPVAPAARRTSPR